MAIDIITSGGIVLAEQLFTQINIIDDNNRIARHPEARQTSGLLYPLDLFRQMAPVWVRAAVDTHGFEGYRDVTLLSVDTIGNLKSGNKTVLIMNAKFVCVLVLMSGLLATSVWAEVSVESIQEQQFYAKLNGSYCYDSAVNAITGANDIKRFCWYVCIGRAFLELIINTNQEKTEIISGPEEELAKELEIKAINAANCSQYDQSLDLITQAINTAPRRASWPFIN
ncbi:unnamed protein product [Medioppia subpectinata]|uniref:Uncharacterized protein n=1 Tax=Medioppia subpectinata TaxID=1979941 RepID=A0A7R9KYI4_9ACAR|nr:unnamed protein product [Medioppia subpectinata]CAG2111873.1 unnamed protein product [Medioppia subpectinata]